MSYLIIFNNQRVLDRIIVNIASKKKNNQFLCESQFSNIVKVIVRKNNLKNDDFKGIIFVEANKLYTKTDAIIHVINHFGFFGRMMAAVLKAIPPKIRNGIYIRLMK